MMNQYFPKLNNNKIFKQNPQIQLYGHRLFKSQTLYEYLLEFLLIFVSPKSEGRVNYEEIKDNTFSFNEIEDESKQIHYYPSPRMGLKRYIFFNRSDIEKRFEVDRFALEHHREHLKQSIVLESTSYDKDFALDVLQDLFYGYNAITGKRSWFAQSLLPLAPEIIFTESIGNKNTRTNKLSVNSTFYEIDTKFQFNQHMFMARGGEVYYLHLLQGFKLDSKQKDNITEKLEKMIISIPQLSLLANFIQEEWEEVVDVPKTNFAEGFHYIVKSIEVIPKEYEDVAKFTLEELNNFLNSELDTFEKVELLGMLIAVQIIRMMTYRSRVVLDIKRKQPWVIDLTKNPQGSVRKQAVQSYEQLEENLYRAIFYAINEENQQKNNIVSSAINDTSLLVRKLGKDIGLIIPPNGVNMRMTLNEDLVKILVLTLIEPGESLVFSTFLEKCYGHYNIIIGPKEAEKHFEDISYLNDFNENEQIFLELLSNCGFLKNLSDATSIVKNPYKG